MATVALLAATFRQFYYYIPCCLWYTIPSFFVGVNMFVIGSMDSVAVDVVEPWLLIRLLCILFLLCTW